jgi:hypothetical protein
MQTKTRFPNAKDLNNPIIRKLAADPCRVPLIHALGLDGFTPALTKGKLNMTTQAMKYAENYMSTRYDLVRPWLILCGSHGQGKSLAAAWILEQEYIEALMAHKAERDKAGFVGELSEKDMPGPGGQFISGQLINQAPPWESGGQLHRWGQLNSTLVIDDLELGYQDTKAGFTGKVEDLLYERQGNLRPTVITTNLNAKEFAEKYGRILEWARKIGQAYEVMGPSLRE